MILDAITLMAGKILYFYMSIFCLSTIFVIVWDAIKYHVAIRFGGNYNYKKQGIARAPKAGL